jgi:hypothetical protein
VEAGIRVNRGVKQDDLTLDGNGHRLTVVFSARGAVLDVDQWNR